MAEVSFNCSTCPHYAAMGNGKSGTCRFNPPVPFLMPGGPDPITGQPTVQQRAFWPVMGENDWCARHPMFGPSQPVDFRLQAEPVGKA